jgi:hypothetical protein
MFGLSVISFFVMRSYQSNLAGWSAVVFGFVSIITMVASRLRKLKNGKIAKSQN